MRGALLLVAICGCGRTGYEPTGAAIDGGLGGGDGAAADGGLAPGDGGPSFTGVEVAPGLEDPGADDLDPSLTADLLEIYFSSNRVDSNQRDIYVSTRDAVNDDWGAPVVVPELSSPQFDVAPEVSPDGLAMVLASNRTDSEGGTDLWVSRRDARDDTWDPPVHEDELSTSRTDLGGSMNADATRIVSCRMNPGSGFDVVEGTRATTTDPWPQPEAVENLSDSGYEADPQIDPTGLVLVMAGEIGDGQMRELYHTTRASLEDTFDPPMRITSVSSGSDEDDPWASPGGALLFFASNRDGDFEIYQASQ